MTTWRTVTGVVPMIDLDPLRWLGDQAKETLADGFTSMMMGVWSGAMWLLKTAFSFLDSFTPAVQDPDLAKLYGITLWVSAAIALITALGQIGLAVLRQDGRGFGTLAAGVVQYGLVVACWIGVCAAVITGASGLTKGILQTLLGVDSFSGYAAGDGFVDTVSGSVQAATLGISALFILIPAAFGHMIIMLVRSAALLVLTATMPIAAAGAMSEGTKSWMWKSIRWFLACALIAPLLALVIGMGTQFAWAGMPDGATSAQSGTQGGTQGGTRGGGQAGAGSVLTAASTSQNIGMSVVGSVIMLVACFTPLVLFRLLAFVDPGTASGASFRSTMNANGGVAGLLRGKSAQGSGAAAGSGAASETAPDGRTSSENGAEAETANRWQSSKIGRFGGKVGGLVAGGMEKTGKVAQVGASMGVDVLGQAGIGNQNYYDTNHTARGGRSPRRQLGDPQAFETPGDTDSDHGSGSRGRPSNSPSNGPGDVPGGGSGGGGVANDIGPQAQAAVEEGAFIA